MRALVIFALSSVCIFAEDRTFTFLHTQPGQDFGEASLVMRNLLFPAEVTTDEGAVSLTVRGDAREIALGAWLFQQLDSSSPIRGARFTTTESGDVIEALSQAGATDSRGLQESATVIRSVGEIRSLFVYQRLHLIVLRGSRVQGNLAQWIGANFDLAAAGSRVPATKQFSDLDPREDTIAVLYLPTEPSVASFQKSVTEIRTALQLRRVFTYSAPRVLVVRGTSDQVAAVERMVHAPN